jgi:hypothetical protein
MSQLQPDPTELEFTTVKFCPACSSDNIQTHPDNEMYQLSLQLPEPSFDEPLSQMTEEANALWLQCATCQFEFQEFDAYTSTRELSDAFGN